MTNLNRAVVRVLFAVIAGVGFAQPTPDKGVQISGRVTDVKGRPLGGVFLSLVSLDRADTIVPITVWSRYDGLVSFSGVAAKKYKFDVLGGPFKIVPATLDVGTSDNVEVGEITVQPDVPSDLKLEQIIVDPLVIKNGLVGPRARTNSFLLAGLSSLEPEAANHQPEPFSGSCDLHFDRYKTVEAFLGGKVKEVRVARVWSSTEAQPAEIQSRIMDVWSAVFRSASCGMMWSEVTFWTLEASVEYEDGKRASILMDDRIHVELRDREGRLWFIRLWPSD